MSCSIKYSKYFLTAIQNRTKERSEARFTNVQKTTEGSKLVYRATFRPTTDDQGLYLGCRAEQFGLKNETLQVQTKVYTHSI